MLSAAAARPGLGDFGWALLALMTAPDLVAGTRERNLRGDRCQRVNGPIRETTEAGISCGFHAGNPNGRVAARQCGEAHKRVWPSLIHQTGVAKSVSAVRNAG